MIRGLRKLFLLLLNVDDNHPYLFSFVISLSLVLYIIFRTPSVDLSSADLSNSSDTIQFIDIERMSAPKRIVKKQISTTEGEVTAESTDRAMGTNDDANAVDISFYPNVAPPKPVGRLKKIYPKSAREGGIEATVTTEILIDISGKVVNVRIIGIRLSKSVPLEMGNVYNRDFASDAKKILLGAQFSPPIVNGKRSPIKMELPLKFKLEDL